jgi:hypothetical protein
VETWRQPNREALATIAMGNRTTARRIIGPGIIETIACRTGTRLADRLTDKEMHLSNSAV